MNRFVNPFQSFDYGFSGIESIRNRFGIDSSYSHGVSRIVRMDSSSPRQPTSGAHGHGHGCTSFSCFLAVSEKPLSGSSASAIFSCQLCLRAKMPPLRPPLRTPLLRWKLAVSKVRKFGQNRFRSPPSNILAQSFQQNWALVVQQNDDNMPGTSSRELKFNESFHSNFATQFVRCQSVVRLLGTHSCFLNPFMNPFDPVIERIQQNRLLIFPSNLHMCQGVMWWSHQQRHKPVNGT